MSAPILSPNLLIQEPPLQVLPSLAVRIGLNEAIVLQQLHYWLQKSDHLHDGYRWVYNTYDQWQENFPFWSIPTIKRAISKLESLDIVMSTDKYNHHKVDRTKWYTIKYNSPMIRRADQNDTSSGSNRSAPVDQNDPLYIETEITAETTTETTSLSKRDAKREWLERSFESFWLLYPRKEGKKDAHRAWMQLSPHQVLVHKMGEALEAQVNNNWHGREKQYIPLPASWLRGKRWEDEIIQPTNGNGRPKPQYWEKDGSYTVEGALAKQRGEI